LGSPPPRQPSWQRGDTEASISGGAVAWRQALTQVAPASKAMVVPSRKGLCGKEDLHWWVIGCKRVACRDIGIRRARRHESAECACGAMKGLAIDDEPMITSAGEETSLLVLI